jgi:hypothetical protein
MEAILASTSVSGSTSWEFIPLSATIRVRTEVVKKDPGHLRI